MHMMCCWQSCGWCPCTDWGFGRSECDRWCNVIYHNGSGNFANAVNKQWLSTLLMNRRSICWVPPLHSLQCPRVRRIVPPFAESDDGVNPRRATDSLPCVTNVRRTSSPSTAKSTKGCPEPGDTCFTNLQSILPIKEPPIPLRHQCTE